jgi:hypothetical protein
MTNTTLNQEINFMVKEFTDSYINVLKNDSRLNHGDYHKSHEIASHILVHHRRTRSIRSNDNRIVQLSEQFWKKNFEVFMLYNNRLNRVVRGINPGKFFSLYCAKLLPLIPE